MDRHINFRRFRLKSIIKEDYKANYNNGTGEIISTYDIYIPTPYKDKHYDRYYAFLNQLAERAGLAYPELLTNLVAGDAFVYLRYYLKKIYKDFILTDVEPIKFTARLIPDLNEVYDENEVTENFYEGEIALYVDEYNGLDNMLTAFEHKKMKEDASIDIGNSIPVFENETKPCENNGILIPEWITHQNVVDEGKRRYV